MPREFDNNPSLEEIRAYMVKADQMVAVAESVTSGELQSQFSTARDAMQFFQGGITVYNIRQKVRHLHVDPIHAMSCNCVSDIVAAEMAQNVAKLFNTGWGIGITGYASPVPEKDIDELFAYVSITHEEKEVLSGMIKAPKGDPVSVRRFYTHEVLSRFARALKKYHPK